MAIQISNAQLTGKDGSGTPFNSYSGSYTISALPNRILVVHVMNEAAAGATSSITSMTYNSVAMTRFVSTGVSYGSGLNTHQYIEGWSLKESSLPASGSNTLAITWDVNIDQEANISILTLYGAKQTGTVPTNTATGASAAGASVTSQSDSITTSVSNSFVLEAYGLGGNNAYTASNGQTIVHQGSNVGLAHLTVMYKQFSATGSQTLGATFSSTAGSTHVLGAFAPEEAGAAFLFTQI